MVVWAGALWQAPRLGVDISAALPSVITGLLPVESHPPLKWGSDHATGKGDDVGVSVVRGTCRDPQVASLQATPSALRGPAGRSV